MSFPLPRPVGEGSRLAVVAPAGPFDREAFQKGVAWLERRYEIVHGTGIFTKTGYFAGSDERRLGELMDAIADPAVDAILCARGGYGATRLLPRIDLEPIRRANKTIVGFSDVTALHAAWVRAGVRSVHAPMVASLGKAEQSSLGKRWIDALEHPDERRGWSLERLDAGDSESGEGILFGGNLAVLGALLGTPFVPPLDDAILFVEDVGERPYRVDRMLTTMNQAGWFRRIRGLVLGAFTGGNPGEDGVRVEDVLEQQFGEAGIPVLRGLSAGHVEDNDPLPFGAPARISENRLEVNF
ncbi:MAG: LD-carboxypeptidase [Verrucomicrobiales bacterium]